jgi:hypothetical protein
VADLQRALHSVHCEALEIIFVASCGCEPCFLTVREDYIEWIRWMGHITENLKGKDHLGFPDIDWTVALKLILKEQDVQLWARFSWHKIQCSGFHKKAESVRPAEQLSAFQ